MRRKLKNKPKQTSRRSGGKYSLKNILILTYENRKTVALILCLSLPIAAWSLGFIQKGYQEFLVKSELLMASAGFKVNDILVEGREHTETSLILAAIGAKEGESLFKCIPQEAKEKLDSLPWVQSATIQRRWPGTIYIRLVERYPIGIWQNSSKLFLIDETGEILDKAQAHEASGMLIVTGPDAPQHLKELLSTLEGNPKIKQRTKSAVFISNRRWDLILDNNVRVKLPEIDVPKALDRLLDMLEQHNLGNGIASIDLRLPDRSFLYVKKNEDDKKNKDKLT